jgi:hypothetical protein
VLWLLSYRVVIVEKLLKWHPRLGYIAGSSGSVLALLLWVAVGRAEDHSWIGPARLHGLIACVVQCVCTRPAANKPAQSTQLQTLHGQTEQVHATPFSHISARACRAVQADHVQAAADTPPEWCEALGGFKSHDREGASCSVIRERAAVTIALCRLDHYRWRVCPDHSGGVVRAGGRITRLAPFVSRGDALSMCSVSYRSLGTSWGERCGVPLLPLVGAVAALEN